MSHQHRTDQKRCSNHRTLQIAAQTPAFAMVFLVSAQPKCSSLRRVETPGSRSSLSTRPVFFQGSALGVIPAHQRAECRTPSASAPAPNQRVSFWNPVAKSRSRVAHSTKLLLPARLPVKGCKVITTDSYLCMWKLHSFSGIF